METERYAGSDCSHQHFMFLQYKSLRSEILGIKERVIKLQVIGISGIPLVIGAGEKFEITAVLMAGPLISLVFAFMLVFEQSSLMRCGVFIKSRIERPPLCPQPDNGWEHWLEEKSARRKAEAFFAWAAYITFAIYFALGTLLAYRATVIELGTEVALLITAVYLGGFFLSLWLVVTNFLTSHGSIGD